MHQRPYEKLVAWKEAHRLCLWIYRLTRKFPPDERFGLISQMRRSASSVPTNIAEGNGKRSKKEKAYYFERALASLEELHYQSVLARDLTYIAKQEYDKADDHIQRISYLLTKLRSSLMKHSSVSSVSSDSSVSSY